MKKIFYIIQFWFWWRFRATEEQKAKHDIFMYGTGIMKGNKRVNPTKFYIK